MINCACEMVQFCSQEGYIYKGLFFPPEGSKPTVIHVHGACGNLWSFDSLSTIASVYQKNGIGLLTFNLKGHDCIAEGHWLNGEFAYVGGSITKFEECIVDIRSAIEFVSQFSHQVVLQGHSMGCERVITYMIETNDHHDTILLSPCNAYDLQQNYLGDKPIDSLLNDLNKSDTENGNMLLNIGYYGIKSGNESYEIPVSRNTLLSIINSNAFKIFRFDNPLQFFVNKRCFCCIGKNDPLQTHDPNAMFNMIRKRFEVIETLLVDGDHELKPHEADAANNITSWILSL